MSREEALKEVQQAFWNKVLAPHLEGADSALIPSHIPIPPALEGEAGLAWRRMLRSEAFTILSEVTPATPWGDKDTPEAELRHLHATASSIHSILIYPLQWDDAGEPILDAPVSSILDGPYLAFVPQDGLAGVKEEVENLNLDPKDLEGALATVRRLAKLYFVQERLAFLLAVTSGGRTFVVDLGGDIPAPVEGVQVRAEICPPSPEMGGFVVKATFSFAPGTGETLLPALRTAFAELGFQSGLARDVATALGLPQIENLLAEAGERVCTRRSVMSPVPVPRATLASANVLAFTRGLGRMFSGYKKVPDLDRLEETAVQEAERHFWVHVEEGLHGVRWTKKAGEGEKEILTVHVEEKEARSLWAKIASSLNKGEGGPGVEVEDPLFENASFFKGGEVVKATNITLWPDPAPSRDTWRRPPPPVRFRRESSPGYMALLEKAAGRPYFADGWLWVPRAGAGREGFRIGGLSSLLFPEGRAAMERLRKREIGDDEKELQRIFHNPTLFPDEDRRVVRDLEDAIVRAKDWLQELSVYDIGPDLLLCVFETFHRQLTPWRAGRLALPDGKEISTAPYRIIRLDPQELRLRLDPGETWGRNWRARLFSKLEALTTFERQSRNAKGRKTDVGDRFLLRVIDGLQGVSEGGAEASDVGLGLTRLLKKEGAFPLDAFFVDVSLDFMANLWAFTVGGDGIVRNAIEEARAAERKTRALPPGKDRAAERQHAAELRQEASGKPYYQHSPRLLTLGNLRDWTRCRKELAWTILAEITPARTRTARGRTRRGRGAATITIGETSFLCCNGKGNRGYKVETWIKKVSTYERRTGPRGGTDAFKAFVEDLQALASDIGLVVELGGQSGADAIATLKAYSLAPLPAYDLILKAYLPQDLEDRLRESLRGAGIEAVDEGEEGPRHPLTTAARAGGLTPADIRTARTRAGWKQEDLAKRLGVSRVLVSYWESGKKAVPEEREKALRTLLAPHLSNPPAHLEGGGP